MTACSVRVPAESAGETPCTCHRNKCGRRQGGRSMSTPPIRNRARPLLRGENCIVGSSPRRRYGISCNGVAVCRNSRISFPWSIGQPHILAASQRGLAALLHRLPKTPTLGVPPVLSSAAEPPISTVMRSAMIASESKTSSIVNPRHGVPSHRGPRVSARRRIVNGIHGRDRRHGTKSATTPAG